jgi:hypothetical protein
LGVSGNEDGQASHKLLVTEYQNETRDSFVADLSGTWKDIVAVTHMKQAPNIFDGNIIESIG